MTLDLVVLGVLIIVNVLNHSPYVAQRWYVPTGVIGSVLIVWIGYRAGVSLTDIGLGPGSWIRGLIWSAGCIAAVTLVYVIGGSMRFTRRFLADDRAVLGPRTLLYKTLVNVPLGTVLFEELAFRGVGLALLDQWLGIWQAVLVSSLLFGLWHILPSLVMHDANGAVGDLLGGGIWGRIQSVLFTVAGTAVAGLVFCALRIYSDSLLTPMALHWAINGLGFIAATWVHRRAGRI
ncbi:MAG: CPBP family intramembrane metalloprotease [Actinobacteria bacterium]|nr:CPBP family intramembrane metalloprotease [Micrococcales bacterium]MCB0903234.1 CPBP family intramembrane metalloprotease [Actinomycetota bacterium]MCO5299004.1 CPBP family intramembrane metalloprotease [Candidatus Nanopelagicales bacterium]MCB9427174.1 CPBP family intramembrane metalloprotease [Actinomycetota bacterium]HPE11913.1 type II CAAX endopeptidase family protein [Actinomycetota bacterium]